MKLREFFYLLGLKPKLREYGYRVDSFDLSPDNRIDFANWLHPAAHPIQIDAAQLAALSEFLNPGDTAIDIGSHIGDTTVPMALAVGSEGCVFGFEPNPASFAVLEANSKLNPGRVRIIPQPYAAGDAPGKLVFNYSDPGLCNGGELRGLNKWRHAHAFAIEVETIHAESWLQTHYPTELSKLKYIKVDAEGADARVLRSMDGLLQKYHPYLRCEIYRHSSAEERREFFRFLMNRGYVIHRFVSLTEYQGEQLGLEDVLHRPHYDIFAVPEV